jgi:succinoglycan biosynthesis transport protein ExoP
MEEDVKGISDYLEILNRHKKLVIYPAIFLILVSAVIAVSLPATYKSSGLILIESQEIPIDLVRSTVTSYADQRIAVIKQKLMTTMRIMDIVKRHNLYVEERQKSPPSVIVNHFKENMFIDMVSANVTDPRSGRAKRANIAFNVSFMDKNPNTAHVVANELTTQFLNENVKTRTARAQETEGFLKEEANKFKLKIQLLEKNIADFKEKNNDSLPELLPYNLSMVESTQKELVDGQNELINLKEQIILMNIELANLDALMPSTGTQQPTTVAQQLALAKGEYTALQDKYSENHPDIKRLKRKIESLELEVKQSVNKTNTHAAQYRSPLSLKLQSSIKSSQREIARILSAKKELKQKLALFEKRVADTHQVKRAYDDLIRDYENNQAKYQELKSKELQAELAKNLESENKGESFTLIEPPRVPGKPEKPNRPKIFILGVAGSIAVGVALALLFELLVGGVRGYNEISRVTGRAPLVVIPMLTVKEEHIVKTTNRYTKLYWLLGAVVILVIGVHFFVMDLEIIWFKVLRKISLL